jgi:ATP-binding cassette subfamily B protein
MDCGAACLAMVLGFYGKPVRIDELRSVLLPGRDGLSAAALVNAARHYGLRGHGIRADIDDFEYLPEGAILHWDFNHFVVFESFRRDGVVIIDPAGGRRTVAMADFRRSFTGVAVVLEPAEDFETGAAPQNIRWRYLQHVLSHRSHWWRIAATSLLLQVFALSLPVLTGLVVDRIVPRADYHLLTVVSGALALSLVFTLLNTLVRGHLLLELRTRFDASLSISLVEHLIELPHQFFQQRRTGDLMMRLGSNAQIRDLLTTGTLSALLDGTMVVLYLAILLAASPVLGLLTLGVGAGQFGVYLLQKRRTRELIRRSLEVQARTQSYQAEMLHGMETLKAMGAEQRAAEHWASLFVETLNLGLERGRLLNLTEAALGTLRLGSPLLILSFGALAVLHGEMSLGTMMAVNALAAGFLAPLGNLAATATQLQQLDGYFERLEDVFCAPREQEPSAVRRCPALVGRVALEGVSFRYSPVARRAVRDATVEIAPGEFVAIVGRTGCGKSTLAGLLIGLLRPTEGRVLYDNADLRELDVRELRRQVGVVTQHAYLFAGTIRSNIALGDPSLPASAITEAAKLASIHDDILAMPMGYDTPLADAGGLLSGGQRQRVALARALAAKPRLLLLDEATSALDPLTEKAVYGCLASLGCTRIVIAHRLSTIAAASQVLVMEDGRIVERGRHAELVGRDSLYRRMVQAQGYASERAG